MTSDSGKLAARQTAATPEDNAEYMKRVGALFEQYHTKLVKALLPQTRSREEAQDIAAQAFSQLLALDQPGKVSFLRAYLYRTAGNILTSQWRARAIRRRDEAVVGYEPVQSDGRPEPQWSEIERVQLLRSSVDRLPARCHNVLVLRIWYELTYEEIVERLAKSGVSVTTRTVERDFAFALEFCRREIEAAEGACDREDE